MKFGICVSYHYDGDEAAWERVVGDFTGALTADRDLAGKLTYHVQKAEAGARLHIGRWDSAETVQLMQSRRYFQPFAKALQALAGDTLKSQRFEVTHSGLPA